ncbi:MAG TPA: Lrp/AsnC ligand binding domain-containing protein [Candidatus Nitrosotalea sp.]|nr:Lrp/AsnC ligand binding domain-containing protein [Nitrososphaerota archaeon]HJT10944.1 Lrp/AsnC ligand binding domain-containing protein [Candidatus Nitrosotalea sp.]HKU32847.1 Lrp/AsnC ligand binding domain-containing protein [Candidatus Nitrosotalea sp.]
MPIAFVLLNAELGKENELLKEVKAIEHVKYVYVLYGAYDLVVKIEAPDNETLKKTISNNIRQLKNVRSTLTMTVIE